MVDPDHTFPWMSGAPQRVIAWIAQSVVTAMTGEASARFPEETGGVLLGYWSQTEDDVVIHHAVGPGPNATHKRLRFHPDSQFHEAEIARIYEMSGRRHTYLGDWHTHPRGGLRLSVRDLRTLSRIARTREARVSVPIMIILAGDEKEWKIAVWRFQGPHGLACILRLASIHRLETCLFG